jgi:uncharacterized delta-60 repeat protein
MQDENWGGHLSSARKLAASCCAVVLCAFAGPEARGADGVSPKDGVEGPYGIDSTFGDGGVVRMAMRSSSPYNEFPQAAGVDSQGRIVVLVEVAPDYFAEGLLLRLLPDGRLDPAFGDAGRVHLDNDGHGQFEHLAIDPSDRVVLVRGPDSNHSRVEIRRFSAAGQPDLAFGVGGYVTIPAPDRLIDWGTTPVTTDAAGDVLVAFTQFTAPPVRATIRVVRLTQSGQLDATFGVDGAAMLPAAYSTWPTAIAVDGAGRVVVGGGVDYFNDVPNAPTETVSPRVALGRFLTDGTPEPTFINSAADPRYGVAPGEAGQISFDSSSRVVIPTWDGLWQFSSNNGSIGPVSTERVSRAGLAVGGRGYLAWEPLDSGAVFVHIDPISRYLKSSIPAPAKVRQMLLLPDGSVVAVGADTALGSGDVNLLVVKLTPGGVAGGPELRPAFEAPVSYRPRARFVRGSFTVTNLGGVARRSTAHLYLSDNPDILDVTATKLRSVSVGRIAAGASRTMRFRAAVPRGASAVGRFLLVQVDATRALGQAWRLDDVAASDPIE